MHSPTAGSCSVSAAGILKPAGAKAKLEDASQRFSTFFNDMELKRQQRLAAETARDQALAGSVLKLEKALEAEQKRRAESDEQLHGAFTEAVRGARDKAAAQHDEVSGEFKACLEGLARSLRDLQQVIK